MIRSSRLVASAGLAVLLLSGCGSGSVRPGAAALVGEQRITVDTLQQVVELRAAEEALAASEMRARAPAQAVEVGRRDR